jgi:uncharacterized OB-fold protein
MSARISNYRGTEISSDHLRDGRYFLTRYETRLTYAWSSGIAIGRFLRGLKDAEIWGRRCNLCKRVVVPPRVYCEFCFRANHSWIKLMDTGRISTYSISHINTDASRRDEPIIVAVINIDGTNPPMGLLHIIGGNSPDGIEVGMPVKAVWRDAAERVGSITDIRYFKPLEE